MCWRPQKSQEQSWDSCIGVRVISKCFHLLYNRNNPWEPCWTYTMEKRCSETSALALVLWLWACWFSLCLRCSFLSVRHPCLEWLAPWACGYYDSRDYLRASLSSWQAQLPGCSVVTSQGSRWAGSMQLGLRQPGWAPQACVFSEGFQSSTTTGFQGH